MQQNTFLVDKLNKIAYTSYNLNKHRNTNMTNTKHNIEEITRGYIYEEDYTFSSLECKIMNNVNDSEVEGELGFTIDNDDCEGF